MKKIEVLSPAGDIEKLKTAIDFGADAVYVGGESFGLRKASKNFTAEELQEAVQYVHDRGKKIHITMNIMPHNEHLDGLESYLKQLVDLNVDAVIVSDVGMIHAIKRYAPTLNIHLSTQASVTNYETVMFWYEFGIRRVILARELSLAEIIEIRRRAPMDMELEVFAHGAMCIAYSGRCLLSNYMTKRDANLGDCAQSCRWKYSLVEEKRPEDSFPIVEEDEGTFIFNSKDLCLLSEVDQLIEAGIDSIKIEGRVKSQYYVATVTRSYRLAVDAFYNGQFTKERAERLIDEIKKVSHRDFTKGFMFQKPDENDQLYENSSYIRSYDFVGTVLSYDDKTMRATIEQRNKVFEGDIVEIFGPRDGYVTTKLQTLLNEKQESIESANQAKQIFTAQVSVPVCSGDFIRRKVEEEVAIH